MRLLCKKDNFTFLVFFCAILISFIYITPHIVGFLKTEANIAYNPMSLEAGPATHFYDEVLVYVPSVREVAEGHLLVKNIDNYEYSNGPMIRHVLSSLVLAPFFIFAGTVTNFIVLTDFVFPLISFILLFLLYFLLTSNKFLSLCFGIITALSPKIFLFLFPLHLASLKDLVKHFVPFKIDMWMQDISDLTKMEAMKPGLPFVLLFLIFLYLSLKTNKRIYVFFCGIFLGSLFYTYAFHWLFFVILTIVLALLLFFKKEYKLFKKVFKIGVIGFIISIPFWINYYYLTLMPYYEEYSNSIGKELGHQIRFDLWPEYLLYGFLIVLVWFLYKEKDRATAFFAISLLLASILIYNIQVITGFQFQSNHWATKVIWLNLAIVWVLIFAKLYEFFRSKKWKNIFKVLLVATVVILISNAFLGKWIWASNKLSFWNIPKNELESFEWLEENTEMDSVIMSPSLITNRYLPLYTNNKIFVPFYENAPSSEVLERIFISYRIFNVPEEYIGDVFVSGKYGIISEENPWNEINFHEKRGIMYVYGFKYADKYLDDEFKKEMSEKMIEGYKKYLTMDINFLVNKYKLDYLYYGPNEKIISPNLENISGLSSEKVYNKDGVVIYKLKHSNN